MAELNIEYIEANRLSLPNRRIRRHTAKKKRKLRKLIQRFGIINPLVINLAYEIVAGSLRYEVGLELGFSHFPCILVEHLTESELRMYALADNRLVEEATYDVSLLKIELKELQQLGMDLEFTGFDTAEIDSWMLLGVDDDEGGEDENIPYPPSSPISRVGDVFTLGVHRLVCGDARKIKVVEGLMQDYLCSLIITDFPYNLKTQDIRGHSEHDFEDFPMAAGEMSSIEFIDFLTCLIENFASVSQDGALHYYFMDWRHLYELLTAARPLFGQFINLCVWCKNNGGMGSFYRSQHELIAVFKHGTAAHINNIELGVHGRYRTNVWNYAGLSAFGADRNTELGLHPTVKPIPLLKDILLDASRINEIVLDGCLGSGSTLIAAQRTHRRCYGIELDPRYVDVAILRWQEETGEDAIHEESGLTFDQLSEQRQQHTEASHG